MLTNVYGPSWASARQQFFHELDNIKPPDDIPWMICGDFNTILDPEDRSSQISNWREPVRFAQLISSLGLINLNLLGRKYTWSNARQAPTMARLDRFLVSSAWRMGFPNSKQEALPNTSSDHCPLLYTTSTKFKKSAFFRFENFWLKSNEFKDYIQQQWSSMPTATNP